MTNPRTLLNAWNLRARKQMGQNFLTNANAAGMIVSRSRLAADDIVIEIGAGLGGFQIPLFERIGIDLWVLGAVAIAERAESSGDSVSRLQTAELSDDLNRILVR